MAKKKSKQKKPEVEDRTAAEQPSVESAGKSEEIEPSESLAPRAARLRKFGVRNMVPEATEIHLKSGTITIPPLGRAKVSEEDLYNSHLRSLERQGTITVSR